LRLSSQETSSLEAHPHSSRRHRPRPISPPRDRRNPAPPPHPSRRLLPPKPPIRKECESHSLPCLTSRHPASKSPGARPPPQISPPQHEQSLRSKLRRSRSYHVAQDPSLTPSLL